MLRKLPGIDIPIATEANILHAAAYLEFKHHVERLVRDRHDTAAYTCCMHAVEVGHSPFVLPTTTEVAVLPPLPKMPGCKPECPRCAAHSGGFKFPWLGLWNTRGVIIPPDVAPDEAWEYYYNHNERMDLILLPANFSPVTAEELVPQDLYALQLRCSAGDAGALGHGEFFAAWRDWALCFPDMGTLPTFMDPRLLPRAPRGRLGESGDRRQQSSPSSARMAGSPRRRPHGVGISLHWLQRPHMEKVLGMLRGTLCRVLRMEAQLYPLWGETEDAHPKLTTFQPRYLTPRSIFLLFEP